VFRVIFRHYYITNDKQLNIGLCRIQFIFLFYFHYYYRYYNYLYNEIFLGLIIIMIINEFLNNYAWKMKRDELLINDVYKN